MAIIFINDLDKKIVKGIDSKIFADSAPPRSTVSLYIGNTYIGSTGSNALGRWSVDLAAFDKWVPKGQSISLTAKFFDDRGKLLSQESSSSFTYFSQSPAPSPITPVSPQPPAPTPPPPPLPTIFTGTITQNVGGVDNVLSQNESKIISGQASIPGFVKLYANNAYVGMVGTDKDGKWAADLKVFEKWLPLDTSLKVESRFFDGNGKQLGVASTNSFVYSSASSPVTPPPAPPQPSPLPIPQPLPVNGNRSIFADDAKLSLNEKFSPTNNQIVKDGFSIWDVRQGVVGDCWWMSTLAGYAYHNPQALQNSLKLNSDGSVMISLFQEIKSSSDSRTPRVDITVSNTTAIDSNGYEKYAKTVSDSWVAMYEKAGVALALETNMPGASTLNGRNGFLSLDWGIPATRAIDGGAPTYKPLIDALNQDVSKGVTISFGIWGHLYTVLDWDPKSFSALLYDPYGAIKDTRKDLGLTETSDIWKYNQTVSSSQGAGNVRDTLTGTSANDIFNGFQGDDFFDGNGGWDLITGGQGKDVFDLRDYNKQGSADAAVIQDFWTKADKLILDKNETYSLGSSTYEGVKVLQVFDSKKDLMANIMGSQTDLSQFSLAASDYVAFM